MSHESYWEIGLIMIELLRRKSIKDAVQIMYFPSRDRSKPSVWTCIGQQQQQSCDKRKRDRNEIRISKDILSLSLWCWALWHRPRKSKLLILFTSFFRFYFLGSGSWDTTDEFFREKKNDAGHRKRIEAWQKSGKILFSSWGIRLTWHARQVKW